MEKNLWSVLETLAPTLIYQRGSMVYWQGDTADRRLARFLAEATGGTRTLPLTDEELGERIGASRVTVSRAMKKLREKGWIRSSYRAVEVLDADALFAYADGEDPPRTRA